MDVLCKCNFQGRVDPATLDVVGVGCHVCDTRSFINKTLKLILKT